MRRAWSSLRGGTCLLLCLLLSGTASAAVRVEAERLSPEAIAASDALVAQAWSRLPAAMREGDVDIALAWREDLPRHVQGRAWNRRIALRRSLLDGWMRRDPVAGLADAGAHAAIAALLHELAHVHDRATGGGLSRDPRLLDLAGWPRHALPPARRVRRNDFSDRSPDPHERTASAEFVAVNLEHYLLDADYACRRPALHRYFVARLGAPGAATTAAPSCSGRLPFVATSAAGDALQRIELDPARVQAVEYLLAEPDARPMSRWGHSMLRLVVCAPGRARGPDCRLDLQHHLVLSFRAFVDDVQVSSWRGLTGAYPSRLFVLPLGQVVDEYTKVELRGLQSLPLRLDEDEIAALLERAAQVHWSYDGRYRFVSNNCAVETWKLLNDGVPRLAGGALRSITPTGLLRRLQGAGIADATVLADPARALREGYRFESLARHFEGLFAQADAELDLPAADAPAWFATDPALRGEWLARGGLRTSAALLVLEQAALRREEAALRERLKQRVLRGQGAELSDLLEALLADGAYAGRPATLLPATGYGVPHGAERDLLDARVAGGDAQLRGLRDTLQAQARALGTAREVARIGATERNLERLGARLRALAAPPRG